jgi:uncharacterized protein YcgL (UPF0745 family)
MGYGCCNEILTDWDRAYAVDEANKLAIKIADEMTQENYHIFVTRDYYSKNIHWRMAEGAGLDDNWITYIAIEKNYGLEVFIYSCDEKIRAAVAAQGYRSSDLIKDKSAVVRAGVAKSGYRLEILVNDEEPIVRAAVAEQGYALDILINDEDESVRRSVAQQGYKTHTLVSDKSSAVRLGLAKSGYELKTLLFDHNFYVHYEAREKFLKNIAHCKNNEEAEEALEYIIKHTPLTGFRARDILKNMNEVTAVEIIQKGYCLSYFINSTNALIRTHVAKQGYGLDILIDDEDAQVRRNVARQGYGLEILINDKDNWVRIAVAEQGYGLAVLRSDEDSLVRLYVAKQGYGLDVLIKDTSSLVRECVAKQGYRLDILLYDNDSNVRKEVAKQGYGLDVLAYDENKYVRAEVARQGYGLEILAKDEDSDVKKAVISQGYVLENFLYDKDSRISGCALEKIMEQTSSMDEVVRLVDSVIQTVPDFIEKLYEDTCIKLMNSGFPLSYFMKHKNRYVVDALVSRRYKLKTFIYDSYYPTKQFAIRKLLDSCTNTDEVIRIVEEILKTDSDYMNKLDFDSFQKFIYKGCPLKYFKNHPRQWVQDLL